MRNDRIPEAASGALWTRGDPYERYMGRWSRLVAREFVRGLGLPPSLSWLDVGCGSGALAHAILTLALPREVIGIDPSDGMLGTAKRQTREGVRFMKGEAHAIPLDDGAVDVAASGLVLNFVPDLAAAMAEMKRVVRSHGILAAYVWDYAEGMQLLRHFWESAVALRPGARDFDESGRYRVCDPRSLVDAFCDAGLIDVAVAPIAIPTDFRDFEELWGSFLEGQGPAPAYLRTLDEAPLIQLRERLRARLPAQADGAVRLTARAWAVKGRRVR